MFLFDYSYFFRLERPLSVPSHHLFIMHLPRMTPHSIQDYYLQLPMIFTNCLWHQLLSERGCNFCHKLILQKGSLGIMFWLHRISPNDSNIWYIHVLYLLIKITCNCWQSKLICYDIDRHRAKNFTCLVPSHRWTIKFKEIRLPTADREQRRNFAINFAPGACKFWGFAANSGSVKALVASSWNVIFTGPFRCRRVMLHKHLLL